LAEAQRGLSIPIFGDGSEEGPMVAMNIAIAEDGSLFLDGQPVELDAIASRAAELGERGRAVIAADGRARHARVVEVITTVRENGVERHALSVRALEEQ
jgi:biopolymer transport protein ExbD